MPLFLIRHPRPLIESGVCYGRLDVEADNPQYTVVAVDLGIKAMTPALMAQRGMTVHVVPATSDYAKIVELQPDGLFFSNGPGDPATAATPVAGKSVNTPSMPRRM